MNAGFEVRLKELGLELPQPSTPPALYSPFQSSGNLVFVSGQPPYLNGSLTHKGKVGKEMSLEEGRLSARQSALNILSHLKRACDGDLGRVTACVHMLVLVNSADDFHDVHLVADGAAGLIRDLFPGFPLPTRCSLGCASLPMNITTEVEATFSIR